MATTAKGIYFPDSNTNVNLLTIFQTLAASVDNALSDFTYDSGWIDVPTSSMQNGWETYNTGTYRVAYRKIGRTIYHSGLIRRGTVETSMYTVPLGFRPSKQVTAIGVTGSGAGSGLGRASARLNVSTAGVISMGVSNLPSVSWISLDSVIYPVD